MTWRCTWCESTDHYGIDCKLWRLPSVEQQLRTELEAAKALCERLEKLRVLDRAEANMFRRERIDGKIYYSWDCGGSSNLPEDRFFKEYTRLDTPPAATSPEAGKVECSRCAAPRGPGEGRLWGNARFCSYKCLDAHRANGAAADPTPPEPDDAPECGKGKAPKARPARACPECGDSLDAFHGSPCPYRKSGAAAPAPADWRTAALVAPEGADPVAWVRAVTSLVERRTRKDHGRDTLARALVDVLRRHLAGEPYTFVHKDVRRAAKTYRAIVSTPAPALFVRRGARVGCDNEHPEE